MRLALLLALAPFACTDAVSESPRGGAFETSPDAAPPQAAPGTARRAGVLRVATFNVRRYFDTICDSGRCAPGDFEEVPTEAAFEAKTERVAAAIARIDADVIALQEIESVRCLEALTEWVSQRGLGYVTTELGETGAPGSVDVALFARAPAVEIRTHRHTSLTRPDGSTTTFARELLEVRMLFGTRPVIVLSAHFRSKVDDDPGRRFAEAVAAREIVRTAARDAPGALVVLAGDLNDEPGSPPLDALEEGGALVRVAGDRPVGDQVTAVFQTRAIAIDHVYVEASGASRYVPASAAVIRDGEAGLAGSDHAALMADFVID